jgi:hypothetical protein
MTALVSMILAVSGLEDLRTNVALSVGPTGVLEQLEADVKGVESKMTAMEEAAKAEIRSEAAELHEAKVKMDAATTAPGRAKAKYEWEEILMLITLYVVGAALVLTAVRLAVSVLLHCCLCWGRTRITEEDKATFPADGTLKDVRMTGFLNFKGLVECFFCTDVLWMENASKMGRCGSCAGFFLLVLVETCVVLFLVAGIAIMMVTNIKVLQGTGLDGGHGIMAAMTSAVTFMLTVFPFPGVPVWILVMLYGWGVYVRATLRAQMQGNEPDTVTNVAAHCCFMCPAGDLGVLFPTGMLVYQEAEYVEVYGKNGVSGAAVPLQEPAQE